MISPYSLIPLFWKSTIWPSERSRSKYSTGSKLEPPPDIAFSRSISRSKSSKDVMAEAVFWGRSGAQKWTFLAPRIGARESGIQDVVNSILEILEHY